jgi:hypothetical protein
VKRIWVCFTANLAYLSYATVTVQVAPFQASPTQTFRDDKFSLTIHRKFKEFLTDVYFVHLFAEYAN